MPYLAGSRHKCVLPYKGLILIKTNQIMEHSIIKFHVGRGGRHNNEGHINYVGEERINEGFAFDELMYNEKEDYYMDSAGNPLHDDLTQEDIESGVGTINIDHQYDTTYTKYPIDLSFKERLAIVNADPYNCASLLGLEKEMYDILVIFDKLNYFVSYDCKTLEDVDIYECNYGEDDEEIINNKSYNLINN